MDTFKDHAYVTGQEYLHRNRGTTIGQVIEFRKRIELEEEVFYAGKLETAIRNSIVETSKEIGESARITSARYIIGELLPDFMVSEDTGKVEIDLLAGVWEEYKDDMPSNQVGLPCPYGLSRANEFFSEYKSLVTIIAAEYNRG